jgi:hypothetical protein
VCAGHSLVHFFKDRSIFIRNKESKRKPTIYCADKSEHANQNFRDKYIMLELSIFAGGAQNNRANGHAYLGNHII